MAVAAQTLFEETKCYACYGLSQYELLYAGMLNRIVSGGGGSGSASVWGQITGTLSNQADLQAALNAISALRWTAVVTKTADQDVINTTVMANDTELFYPVVAGGIYYVEVTIKYSGTDAGADFKGAFSIPDLTGGNVQGSTGTKNYYLINLSNAFSPTTFSATQIPAATDEYFLGVTAPPPVFSLPFVAKFLFINGLNAGNLQWKFAAIAALGQTVTTKAGSTLFIKKLN